MHRNFVQFVVAVGFFSVYCDGIHKGFGCAKVQFPYFALLQIPDPNGTLSCGATILSKKWLLTAAHCVRDAKNMTAYMGQKHYTEQSAESRFIKAKHIYTNSKYNATDQNNDIALLKLRKPIVFNDEIKPVMISNECHLGPDEIVFAVGYGAENYEGDISPKLQWAPLKLTSQKRCYDILDFLKPRQNYLCVGSNSNRSICSGDSGGPLIRKVDKSLVGVTSLICRKDCAKGHPQVFAKVLTYSKWISKLTGISIPPCNHN